MTRTGKIARLSKNLRDLVGSSLQNGEPASRLLPLLNESREVQHILHAYFDGHPITEQNLSEWKTGGGYQDWVRDQQARLLAQQLTDRATALDQATGPLALSDRLATVLTEQFSRLALRLMEQETDPDKQWHRLCQINRELSQLRRADHHALHLKLERERWEWTRQQALAKAEREQESVRKRENREFGALVDRLAAGMKEQTRALTAATPRGQRPESPFAEPVPPVSQPAVSPISQSAGRSEVCRSQSPVTPETSIQVNPTESDRSNPVAPGRSCPPPQAQSLTPNASSASPASPASFSPATPDASSPNPTESDPSNPAHPADDQPHPALRGQRAESPSAPSHSSHSSHSSYQSSASSSPLAPSAPIQPNPTKSNPPTSDPAAMETSPAPFAPFPSFASLSPDSPDSSHSPVNLAAGLVARSLPTAGGAANCGEHQFAAAPQRRTPRSADLQSA